LHCEIIANPFRQKFKLVICFCHQHSFDIYRDKDTNWEYKTVNLKFKKRWTNSELNTDELDGLTNAQATLGWHIVSVSIPSLFGYPQSALCVYKKTTWLLSPSVSR
jgi:hypothetical protein